MLLLRSLWRSRTSRVAAHSEKEGCDRLDFQSSLTLSLSVTALSPSVFIASERPLTVLLASLRITNSMSFLTGAIRQAAAGTRIRAAMLNGRVALPLASQQQQGE